MPKRQRGGRCIACVRHHQSCPDDCEFKKFFPNDNEIDYSNFFKVVKGASALRALLNETIDGRVKTDAEKLAQIRAILIEGNISQKYPISRAAGIIYTLLKRIEYLESQPPETSRTNSMAPLSFSSATVTRDPLYNVDSFTGMNSSLDPFLNFSAQYFPNDSAAGSMGSSTGGVGGSAGINPHRDLVSAGSVGTGSNTKEEGRMFCSSCHTGVSDFAMPYGSFPRNNFTAASAVQTICSSIANSLVGVHPSFRSGSNQTEPHLTVQSVNPVDQDPHLQQYNPGVVIGAPASLPPNLGVVIGVPVSLPQMSEGVPAPLPQPSESNILEFVEDMDDLERMIELLADTLTPLSSTGDGDQEVRKEGTTVDRN